MAWELSSDLQKQVKDDQEYSESELFESEKSDSSSETEDVEGMEDVEASRNGRERIDDDDNIR